MFVVTYASRDVAIGMCAASNYMGCITHSSSEGNTNENGGRVVVRFAISHEKCGTAKDRDDVRLLIDRVALRVYPQLDSRNYDVAFLKDGSGVEVVVRPDEHCFISHRVEGVIFALETDASGRAHVVEVSKANHPDTLNRLKEKQRQCQPQRKVADACLHALFNRHCDDVTPGSTFSHEQYVASVGRYVHLDATGIHLTMAAVAECDIYSYLAVADDVNGGLCVCAKVPRLDTPCKATSTRPTDLRVASNEFAVHSMNKRDVKYFPPGGTRPCIEVIAHRFILSCNCVEVEDLGVLNISCSGPVATITDALGALKESCEAIRAEISDQRKAGTQLDRLVHFMQDAMSERFSKKKRPRSDETSDDGPLLAVPPLGELHSTKEGDTIGFDECKTVEFKCFVGTWTSSDSSDHQNNTERLRQAICGMANTWGGTLFVGVDDSGTIRGHRSPLAPLLRTTGFCPAMVKDYVIVRETAVSSKGAASQLPADWWRRPNSENSETKTDTDQKGAGYVTVVRVKRGPAPFYICGRYRGKADITGMYPMMRGCASTVAMSTTTLRARIAQELAKSGSANDAK